MEFVVNNLTARNAYDLVRDVKSLRQNYGQVSVGDVNDILGRESSIDDFKKGWSDLEGVTIETDQSFQGYSVRFPEPVNTEISAFTSKKPEQVDHPSHYLAGNMEAIDVIEAFSDDLTGDIAFAHGNAIKYLLRFNKKDNPKQDLEKAKWYIDYIIENWYNQKREG